MLLDELRIADLTVIEEATLRLAPGLTVVTGETGAGKTMVVTALELLLGERADPDLVRAGSTAAVVEARAVPPPPNAVDDGWAGADDDELVVSREVVSRDASGSARSRARIGGRLAPVSALADVLGRWVEVHAQGEHARLARPDVQRALLDRYAGDPHGRTLAAYRGAWRARQDVREQLESLEGDRRERAREAERLRYEIDEIDAAGLDPDRDPQLAEERSRLEHAEQLAEAAARAAAALGEDGASVPLGVAVEALRHAAGHDRELDDLLARVEGLVAEIVEARRDLDRYGEHVESDPQRLEELRARQRLVADLTRKYGDDVAAVLAYRAEAEERLGRLDVDDRTACELADRASELDADLERLAGDVRDGRLLAAERLTADVTRHLVDLAMPHATFTIEVEPAEAGQDGADRVAFVLAPNPGEPARPLATAASGGERSRVALAVEVALADVDDARVLVFDEVDAGVGGATAMAVGEKLARLAAGRQVLCVTHLAQLAAFADVHHVVEKGIRDGRTVTTTRRVDDDERPAELLRMLSGVTDRESGLAHARELLGEARRRRAG